MKRKVLATLVVFLCVLADGTLAIASDDAEHGPGLFYPMLNLALLIAVLIYFARQPIKDFFAGRRDEIEGALKAAAELRAEAESRYAQWQRKLADLDADLDQIRSQSRDRAETEREQILADAEATAERIRNDARAAVEMEVRSAREALREEAADLAIELAARRLDAEVNDGDRERLLDEFIERVEQSERT